MDNFNRIEEIEAYLEGKMNPEEKTDFENQLKKQPELEELLNTLKMSRNSIRLSGYKKAIYDTQKEYLSSRSKIQTKSKTKIIPVFIQGIAASLIFFLLASAILIIDTKQNFYDRKYLSYKIPVERSGNQNQETLETLFQEEKWTAITEVPPAPAPNQQELFFFGMAHYNLENYDRAKTQFLALEEKNQDGETVIFKDESEFYLVFIHIRLGEYSEAARLIEQINNTPDHNYLGYFSNWDQFRLQLLSIF